MAMTPVAGTCSDIGEAVWAWDLASNSMTATPAYYELLGIEPASVLKPFHIVPMIHEDDRDQVLASLFQTIAGEQVASVTFRVVRSDRTERLVIGKATMRPDDSGMRSIVHGSLTDVTETDHLQPNSSRHERPAVQVPVLVVGRDRFARMGLVSILSESSRIEVIGEVLPDARAISAAWAQRDDLPGFAAPTVVLDIDEPQDAFEQLVRELLASDPRIRVLALVRYAALDIVAAVARAGAGRLLTAEVSQHQLQQSVWQLGIGGTGYDKAPESPAIYGEYNPGFQGNAQLTATEARILRLLAGGLRNREIGAALFMSEPTIKRHTQQIYRKLGARDRAHAAALANHYGLLR